MMKFVSLFAIFSTLFLVSIVQDVNAFTTRSMVNTRATIKTLQSATTSDDVIEKNTMIYSRRNAMREGLFKTGVAAAVVVGAVATVPDAAFADIYDEQEKARKLKAKEDGENGKKKIPYILGGGFLLSLPFFLPNLLRLGTKLGSGGKDDGYGN